MVTGHDVSGASCKMQRVIFKTIQSNVNPQNTYHFEANFLKKKKSFLSRYPNVC